MSASPSPDALEQRAAEQRERIHQTALELIDEAKQQLSLEHHLRRHFGGASLISCSLALLFGYAVADLFRRH